MRVTAVALAIVALAACSSSGGAGEGASAPADPLGLPDALTLNDGRKVTTKEQWSGERRTELLEIFAREVYGRAPGPPESLAFDVLEEDPSAMGGTATLRRVAIKSKQAGREHTFQLIRFSPNAKPRSGAFLVLSTKPASATDPTRAVKNEYWPAEDVVARGYTIVAVQTDEIAPDDPATFGSGVIRLFEGDGASRPPDAWKMIAAWSWGARRALDYLVTDPMVDPAKIAVVGHSRGGKAALWAGAQDERFSMVVSNESGCAGAAISRRPVGENVELVNTFYPYFFADTFRAYDGNEAKLPIDQHELLALVAPRALVVASASQDEWSDPEGEYLGLAYASPVYSLFGFEPVPLTGWPAPGQSLFVAPRAYHLRVGTHAMTAWDWAHYLDVADQVWR